MANLRRAITADPQWNGNVSLDTAALSGSAQFTISPVAIAVTLDPTLNQQSTVFTNRPVSLDLSDFIPRLHAGVAGTPTIPAGTLTADDYTITDSDGHVVTAPTAVGTYHVALNNRGIARLATLSGNFTWPTSATGVGLLTISPAAAHATLTGTAIKPYDGTAVTTGQVNAGGNITVTVTYPHVTASAASLTYTLTDGDYVWDTADGSAPVHVGNYWLILTHAGKEKIQRALNNQFGAGNVALADEASGHADFDIIPFELHVTVTGSAVVPSGTTTIPANTYSLHYSGEGGAALPTGLSQPTGNLNPTDLHFVGPAPTATTAGQDFVVGYSGTLADLRAQLGRNYDVTYTEPSPNYHVTMASSQTVQYVNSRGEVILTLPTIHGDRGTSVAFDNAAHMPANWVLADGETAPTRITISGGVTRITIKHGTKLITKATPTDWPRNLELTDFSKDITRTINVTDPADHTTTTRQTANVERTGIKDLVTNSVTWNPWSTGTWAAFTTPTIAGYTPSQTGLPEVVVNSTTADRTVDITYTANPQTTTVTFVDNDNHGSTVGTPQTIHGVTNQTITLNLTVPTNYVLARGQALPTSYHFKASGNDPIVIQLIHQRVPLDPTKPGTLPHNVSPADFTKTVTRTIIADLPGGSTRNLSQSTTLTRTGVYDLVTDKPIWNSWSTSRFAAVTTPTVPGYTASQSEVPSVDPVTSDFSDPHITITYTANVQTVTVQFVDDDNHGSTVGTPQTFNGVTDQTIDLNLTVPTNYVLARGQALPTTYQFKASDNTPIVIHLVHKTVPLDPTKPTPLPSGIKPEDMSRLIQRTIIANMPDGSYQSLSQQTTLTRTGVYDLVTGQASWGPWTTSSFSAVVPPAVAGYLPSPLTIPPVETVTIDYVDPYIVVTYQPVSQPTTPVGPTSPTTPTIPTAPTTPTSPTAPTIPTSPTSPTSPTTPTSPTSPTTPTAPTSPTMPTTPTSPSVPVEPTSPTAPTTPQQPTAPGQSTNAGQAGQQSSSTTAPSSTKQHQSTQSAGTKPAASGRLPQTGNQRNHWGLLGLLSIGISGLLGIDRRKKHGSEK